MTARLRAEDIPVGHTFDLGDAVTLTQAEIVAFANDWDPQDFHVDEHSPGAARHGGVIASGIQTMALYMRLASRVYNGWEIVAGRTIRDAEFLHPVYAGMRLHGRMTVERVEHYSPTRSNVTHVGALVDEDEREVLTLRLEAVVLRRDPGDEGGGR